MKKEKAVALSEKAIAELAESLAAGQSDQLKQYLSMMGSLHNYSFGNCLLIARQFPAATMVSGFHAWRKRGRAVKKGEKGICILAPLVRKKEEGEQEEAEIFGFRAVHVFDVSQTEGEELPEMARVQGEPGEWLDKLHAVVRKRGIELGYEESLGGAEGVSKGGTICLRKGLSLAEEFAVLVHEVAHERLHHGEDRKQYSKVVRETEAEAVAFVVAKAAGLENALEQSTDYIQLYRGDKELLLKSLERVQKTASKLLTELEEVATSVSH